MKISLITPTKDRQHLFPNLLRMVNRSIDRLPPEYEVEWLFVEDGERSTDVPNWVSHLHRPPSPSPLESFLGNLKEGLAQATGNLIFIIEDDDWMAPEYLSQYVFWAEKNPDKLLFGESKAKYYHIGLRRFYTNSNKRHASLCQTAFRRELLPLVRSIVDSSEDFFIDLKLWKQVDELNHFLLPNSILKVGIKGLAPGLGAGHRAHSYSSLFEWVGIDKEGKRLAEWIGEEDAAIYFGLI